MNRNRFPVDDDRTPGDVDAELNNAEDTISLTLAEETLDAHIVERPQGKVTLHKRIETEPVVANVDLHHDEFDIDEVEMNEEADERREPWYEGDTLMVPVYEEALVARTQLMLRRVIQLKNKRPSEQVNLKGTIRREVVEITEPENPGRG